MFQHSNAAFGVTTAFCWATIFASAMHTNAQEKAPRSLTPMQERILQSKPTNSEPAQRKSTQKSNRLVDVEMNLTRFLSFRYDVVRATDLNPKIISTRFLNPRTLAIQGLAAEESQLRVFTERFRGDKVGQSQIFRIAVRTPGEIATERATKSLVFLKPVLLAGTSPPHYLWRINVRDDTVFSSLNAPELYSWLATLPANTKIFLQSTKEWEEDFTAYSAQERDALRDFCVAQNLQPMFATSQTQSQTPQLPQPNTLPK